MAECMLMQGGGGIKSDDVTAKASDVRAGKTYLGADTSDGIGTGTLTFRPSMVQYNHESPNNNYDYGFPNSGRRSGQIKVNQRCYVEYRWSISDYGTEDYEIYVNSTRISTAISGSWKGWLNAGNSITYCYRGAHASSDHYGSIALVGMVVIEG